MNISWNYVCYESKRQWGWAKIRREETNVENNKIYRTREKLQGWKKDEEMEKYKKNVITFRCIFPGALYRINMWCLRILCYAVPHNSRLKTSVFLYLVLQQVCEVMAFLGYIRKLSFFLHPSFAMSHTFIYERDCFYKGCVQ